ncbi:MAG TPA: hypothetical protein VFA48_02220 [Gammaproteobacteria bacterium]|nr:hypothetical protein [Gammaproteobacteria bacterium]
MATFRIEEFYPREDGTREILGSYRIPDSEPDKVAALLNVLSAEGRRAGGYPKTAVFLDDKPVTVFVDEHDKLGIVHEKGPEHHELVAAPPLAGKALDGHTISIHEYYEQPDGERQTFGIYRVPAEDRRKAAAILEVATARQLRSGGYGDVAVYLDDKLMSTRIDNEGRLQVAPIGGE